MYKEKVEKTKKLPKTYDRWLQELQNIIGVLIQNNIHKSIF